MKRQQFKTYFIQIYFAEFGLFVLENHYFSSKEVYALLTNVTFWNQSLAVFQHCSFIQTETDVQCHPENKKSHVPSL